MLLALVFVLSAFLDNIAAAMIGATVARRCLPPQGAHRISRGDRRGRECRRLGQRDRRHHHHDDVAGRRRAARRAARLRGGDRGVRRVRDSRRARSSSASRPSRRMPDADIAVDWARVIIVVLILVERHRRQHPREPAAATEQAGAFPYIGATVIGVILLLTPWRRPDWKAVPGGREGQRVPAVAGAARRRMMPVDRLPAASAQTTFGLGFVSAVFDNIPLTKLALEQGGYDWGALAYAVGFGGSMIWFGSSAGVAVSNLFPEAKSVGQWLRAGLARRRGVCRRLRRPDARAGLEPASAVVTRAVPEIRYHLAIPRVGRELPRDCGRIGRHGRKQSHHPRAEARPACARHHLRHAGQAHLAERTVGQAHPVARLAEPAAARPHLRSRGHFDGRADAAGVLGAGGSVEHADARCRRRRSPPIRSC